MDNQSLMKKLSDLKEELEDLEEERDFMLSKTYIHVPGSARGKYDQEINELKTKISEIEQKIKAGSPI